MSDNTINEWNSVVYEETGFTLGILKRLTPTKVGSHSTDLGSQSINRGTMVRVSKGFQKTLMHVETVTDLRCALAKHFSIKGDQFMPSQFVIFGIDKRVLHGSTRIIHRAIA